jgi:hypothetical protein
VYKLRFGLCRIYARINFATWIQPYQSTAEPESAALREETTQGGAGSVKQAEQSPNCRYLWDEVS